MDRPSLRRAYGVVGALVLVGALGACASDSDEGEDGSAGGDTSAALSESDAEAALLATDDVPEGFAEIDDDDDETPSPGCLAAIDTLSEVDAETETERTFEMETETGASQILSAVNSYDDEDTIVDALEQFRSDLEGCGTISETDDEGFTVDFELTVDEDSTNDAADEQVNLLATGTLSAGPDVFPTVAAFTIGRVANSLAVVAVFEFGDSLGTGGDVDAYYQIVVDRLADAG